MRRPPRIILHRPFTSQTSTTTTNRLSFGFSGAGFLGCYHVGVASCLNHQGLLPHPDDDSYNAATFPLLTGVSAGSMVAAASAAGVRPDPDGMDVVLEASRRTRAFSKRASISLDALTPGFGLIDQVEGAFREAMAKALGGYCEKKNADDDDDDDDSKSKSDIAIRDIDPELFATRFPEGSLRIGLTDRRDLSPPFGKAYRYVGTYRDLEDIVACCMLSSYIPGVTGLINVKDNAPLFLGGLLSTSSADAKDSVDTQFGSDSSGKAAYRLKEMTQLGMVKHGTTGLPVLEDHDPTIQEEGKESSKISHGPNFYWDGGLSDMFPTFDENTVVVAPLNGLFDSNPSISPLMPDEEPDTSYRSTMIRHCPKFQLALNPKNATAALKMIFSSDDDALYLSFREGYDDTRRYLDKCGQLRVFSG
mmetsp:Transcript_19420/g.40970  ORF Transcript_19420/g.40970 Transcript_19420/m.40970 type:complete len:419 (+) Transcript_19420:49-1305(+)